MNTAGARTLGLILCFAGALVGCSRALPPPHSPGGPHYFEDFIHPFPSFYPTLPHREISAEQAKARAGWIEAYFNERGQIERMVKYLAGEPSFDLRYYYAIDGSYERETLAPLHEDNLSN